MMDEVLCRVQPRVSDPYRGSERNQKSREWEHRCASMSHLDPYLRSPLYWTSQGFERECKHGEPSLSWTERFLRWVGLRKIPVVLPQSRTTAGEVQSRVFWYPPY